VSLPSGVWGGAPAEIEFSEFSASMTLRASTPKG